MKILMHCPSCVMIFKPSIRNTCLATCLTACSCPPDTRFFSTGPKRLKTNPLIAPDLAIPNKDDANAPSCLFTFGLIVTFSLLSLSKMKSTDLFSLIGMVKLGKELLNSVWFKCSHAASTKLLTGVSFQCSKDSCLKPKVSQGKSVSFSGHNILPLTRKGRSTLAKPDMNLCSV